MIDFVTISFLIFLFLAKMIDFVAAFSIAFCLVLLAVWISDFIVNSPAQRKIAADQKKLNEATDYIIKTMEENNVIFLRKEDEDSVKFICLCNRIGVSMPIKNVDVIFDLKRRLENMECVKMMWPKILDL